MSLPPNLITQGDTAVYLLCGNKNSSNVVHKASLRATDRTRLETACGICAWLDEWNAYRLEVKDGKPLVPDGKRLCKKCFRST